MNVRKLTKEELGTIIMDNKNLFYHVAKSILSNDDDCADAISEMIVKGYAKMDKIKNKNAAKAWLVRILVHECYNILRHPQALELPDDLAYEEPKENKNLNDVLYELPDLLHQYRDVHPGRVCADLGKPAACGGEGAGLCHGAQ